MTRWHAGLVLALVTAGAVSGCGINAEDTARVVDEDELGTFPAAATIAGSTTGVTAGDSARVELYFVRGTRLTRVVALLPERSTPLDVVRALSRPVPGAAAGVRSALLDAGAVTSVRLRDGTAHVDLGPPFADTPDRDQIVALAQIVYTVTEIPGVGLVRFTLEGDRIETPRGDGSLVRRTVSRDDYADLAPRD